MNDHLRSALDVSADAYDVPPGDLDAVRRRARRRSNQRHRLTGAVAALALLAGTVTVLRLDDGGEASVNADAPEAALGDAGITWSVAGTPETSIGGLGQWRWQGSSGPGGATFGLSTAPADQPDDPRRYVWRSADGIEWTMGSTPDDLFLTELTADDEQLWAIGTGPATNGAPSARIGRSADGDTWSSAALPLDMAAIDAVTEQFRVHPQDIAAGPNGVVAVVTVGADVDVPGLLPDGVDAPNGWAYDASGVDVLGDGPACPADTKPYPPEAEERGGRQKAALMDDGEQRTRHWDQTCWSADGSSRTVAPGEARGVVAHYGWEDLGVGADLAATLTGHPLAFHSVDGETFEPVALAPELALTPGSGMLAADDDGFTYVVGRTTPDARQEVVVLRSVDGRTWTTGPALAGAYDAMAIGSVDGRLAVVASAESGPVYAELDGTWRTTPLAGFVGEGGDKAWISAAAIGPLGVVLAYGRPDGDDAVANGLLASRDGRTWQHDDVARLVGEPRTLGVTHIVIRDDRAMLTVGVRDGETSSKQVALVGTPR